jgi:hypothetical protein
MHHKQSIYEVRMSEVAPQELNFILKSVKLAVFGFSEESDRYTQIAEALDSRYVSHSPPTISLMRKAQVTKIKKQIKRRSHRRPDGSPNGVLILPLEALWPSQSGDDPKTLI